jgi:hypothetical protein
MKKIFIIALSVVALTFSSCADFLNTSPQGAPTAGTFFQNDDQAVAFAKGLYERYSGEWLYGRNIMWEQIAANDFVLGRTYADRFSGALMTITGDEGSIRDIYNGCYTQMANAQWGIQKLNAKLAANGSLSEIETRSLGEAYFFRALYHWAVASRHGLGTLGVPFKPWEEYEAGYNNEILPQLPSVVDNYLYIIADLKKAEELLPWAGSITATYGAGDRGRAHKVSAIGYQAKVWAYMATWKSECDKRGLKPWDEVEKVVNRLESEYGRGLNDSFSDLWSSDFAKFWNNECIFSITSSGGSEGQGGSEFPGVILENQGWGYFNGWGQFKASYDIVAEMEKDNWGKDENGNAVRNERLSKSVWQYGDYMVFFGDPRVYWSATDAESCLAVKKYYDAFKHKDPVENGYVNKSGDWPTTRINFHLLRFADLMLLRAEACLHLYGKDTHGDIAAVHERSTGNATRAAYLKSSASWADLYHERRCELAFEMTGHLEDIKRWTVMKNNGQSIGALGDLAYEELIKHPDVYHAKLSPMYGLLTDKDGKYFDKDGDGQMDYGQLFVKVDYKDGQPVLDKEYSYTDDNGKGIPVTKTVKFDGVDELGNGTVGGKTVAYCGARNNPGAVLEVGPYQDYNNPRTWNDNLIAFPYPTSEITKAGGLYQQVPR